MLSKNCCRNKLTFNPWTWKLPIQESAHDKICKTASTTILHECITYLHIHQTHICVRMFAVWPAWWYWSECLGIRVRYWQSIGYLYCVYCTHACLYCTHSHYGWRNNEYIYLRRRWAELPADIRRGWWQSHNNAINILSTLLHLTIKLVFWFADDYKWCKTYFCHGYQGRCLTFVRFHI